MGKIITAALVLFLPLVASTALSASPREEFKLKPGAGGEQCLECHKELQKELDASHLHPLVKSRECASCHEPHASDHSKLLTSAPTALCIECHSKVIPAGAHSVHETALKGNCVQCHAAHGSEYPNHLKKTGNELCFECHQQIAEEATRVRFKHKPVTMEAGCLNCHQPHASADQQNLLRSSPPTLCRTCHRTSDASFRRGHQNYPVEQADCSGCHSPHGSNRSGILQDTVHPPLVEKSCDTCHNPPGSAQPSGVKQQGTELCRQCHQDWVEKALGKQRVHWPMLSEDGCSQCHSPHAARQKSLLPHRTGAVCGQCHGDTLELQRLARENPMTPNLCEPVKKGNCTACHSPHSANQALLFEAPSSIQLCGKCHDWQTHSTHPIGEKVVDPRNRNLSMDCLSCHRGCGTANYPNTLDFPTTYDLCVSCHVDRKR